jgi:hypothetical protein
MLRIVNTVTWNMTGKKLRALTDGAVLYALSGNQRSSLLAFDGERVTFRWADYAHGSKQRKMTLSAAEFLRRFAQHICLAA